MDLYLHVGTAKTGTTTIQRFMATRREQLLDHSCLYPRSPGKGRHVQLSFYAKEVADAQRMNEWIRSGRSNLQAFRSDFERRFRGEMRATAARRVVLSDEGLGGLPSDGVGRLRELFDDLFENVYVVMYLRPQQELIPSRYQQNVKMGAIYTLEEYLGRLTPRTFDYHRRLSVWSHHFGAENMRPRLFQQQSFVDGSLLADFLHVVGVTEMLETDVDAATPAAIRRLAAGRANPSLDADRLEYLRRMNVLIAQIADKHQRVRFRRHLATILAEQSDGPRLSPPGETLDEITARLFEASNARTLADYFPDHQGPLFDPVAAAPSTTMEPDTGAERLLQIAFETSLRLWRDQESTGASEPDSPSAAERQPAAPAGSGPSSPPRPGPAATGRPAGIRAAAGSVARRLRRLLGRPDPG